MIVFAECKNNNDEQQATASSTSSEHPHADSALIDNQVKAEAPDATGKVEQGYALPRHGADLAQSPIDIISDKTAKDSKQPVSLSFHSDINAAENLGHTIQLDFKNGSTCTVNGKEYVSKQFHFHTPSEHLIDGLTFPMEMHIVNVLTDSSNSNKSSYLVLGILFKIGAENKFINEFLKKIPHEEGEKNELKSGEVAPNDLLSQFPGNKIKSYYTYKGSLTTPPFTEAVQWVILKDPVEASEEQIEAIEKIEGNNARHVQAINDRKVYSQ
jgi:carbonic anhydrase